MTVVVILAVLLVIAAIISLALSFLGIVIVGALKMLPFVFIALAVFFFVSGGRISIHFPKKKD